jgi:hypothetical protein
MNQRLKRWESPRKEGRNHKGKGGSARQRQKKKQFQMLRKKLKGDPVNGISFFYQTGFPHADCLFEYVEFKTWCGFKPKIPRLPAFWGYVDRSDRAIYTKKSIRFEISDRTLEDAIIQLEKRYANLWFGIDCLDFAIEAA